MLNDPSSPEDRANWQGEIQSSGTTSNFSSLAPEFVEIMFDNYGETVINKNFRKNLSR